MQVYVATYAHAFAPVQTITCMCTCSFRTICSCCAPLPPTQCPFIRGVYLLSGGKKGASVLGCLLNRVTDVNLSGLCLNEMPEDVQMAALSTYKLTR